MRLFMIWLASFVVCLLLVVALVVPHSRFECEYKGMYSTYGYYSSYCDYRHHIWIKANYPPFGEYSLYNLYCCTEAS